MQQSAPSGELDLVSETLRVESKLFYLDLKENSRGKYLKIAEKGTNRERSTVIVPAAGIPWFKELFNFFVAHGQPGTKELPIEAKVFFFEVGDNPRGRFLRVSESGSGPKGRSSIIVPSGGQENAAWVNFRDALARIEAAHLQPPPPAGPQPVGEGPSLAAVAVEGSATVVGPGPAPPTLQPTDRGGFLLRAGHKRFFFDPSVNQKGAFLRLTEVTGNERVAVIVPAEALPHFQTAIAACMEQPPLGPLH